MIEFLLGTLCVLSAVTVIGHGLWVGIAKIRAALNGEPVQNNARTCNRCGLPIRGGNCQACGWPNPPGLVQPRATPALDTLRQQVTQLGELGVLDPTTIENLTRAIRAEHDRAVLAELRPVPKPVMAPLAPPKLRPPVIPPADDFIVAEVARDVEPARPVAPPLAPLSPRAESLPQREPSVTERAAAYQAHRAEALGAPPTIVAPPVPRRSWTDWLAGFMEDSNIRWGELVAGMLIVCCSIALVISFWSAIAERPWLKFLLFNGLTAALFGVGFLTEYRWRLRMTSQGLLTIGSMLVPLNFLAIAAFSDVPEGTGLLTIVGEVISAGLFAVLLYYAGRVLVRRDEAWLMAGILVPALAQLLVRRFVHPGADPRTLAAVAAPCVGCYLLTNFWYSRHATQTLVLAEPQVNALLRFLGLTSFAVALPLALLAAKTGAPLATLRQLPLLFVFVGLAPLGVGLSIWQKLAGRGMAGLRTAGTSVAVAGAGLSLAGLVLGWPEPRAMVPAALAEFLVFTGVARRFRLPRAHMLAAACLALGYLCLVHLWAGDIAWSGNHPLALAQALLSGSSGLLIAPLVLGYGGAAFLAARKNSDAKPALVGSAVALATFSTVLLSWFGLGVYGDPFGASWIYLLYGLGVLAIAARRSSIAPAWTGAGLLLAAAVQGIVFHYGEAWNLTAPPLAALLVFATLTALLAATARWTGLARANSPLQGVLWQAALAGSVAAALWLAALTPRTAVLFAAGQWAWISALWLIVALGTGWLPVWTLFQAGLSVTTIYAGCLVVARQAWFGTTPSVWRDPRAWQIVGAALVSLNYLWIAARIVASWRGTARLRALLSSPWLQLDRALTVALVGLVVALASYAALPGVLQELSPRAPAPAARVVPPVEQFEVLGIAHTLAGGMGAWLLLAELLVLLIATMRASRALIWPAALLVTVAALGPLVAAGFASQVAVASALRWSSTAFLLIASIAIWLCEPLSRWSARFGWPGGRPGSSARLRDGVFFLVLLPQLLMTLTIGIQAMARSQQTTPLWNDSYWLLVLAGVALAVVIGLLASARVLATDAQQPRAAWPWAAASLLGVLGTAPLVAMIVYHVGVALRAQPILGPNLDSIFVRMGLASSYAVPLLVTSFTLIGYALRERSSRFALAGGLVMNLGATTAYLFVISRGGLNLDTVGWLRLAQLNAIVAGGYVLAWLGLVAWSRRRSDVQTDLALDAPLAVQSALGPALWALAIAGVWSRLFVYPQGIGLLPAMPVELADLPGWLSLTVVTGSVLALAVVARRTLGALAASAFLTALAVFAASIAARLDTGNLLSYCTLGCGHTMAAALLLAVGAWQSTERRWNAGWVVAQLTAVLLLALRIVDEDQWWTVAGLTSVAALSAASACLYRRGRWLYLAAGCTWLAVLLTAGRLTSFNDLSDLAYWSVVALALPVPIWLAIETWRIRGEHPSPWPVHRVATRLALAILTVTVGAGLYSDALGQTPATAGPLSFGALAAMGVAALAGLWDAKSRDSVALLYVLGLVACGLLLDSLDLEPSWLLWTGTMVLAAYTLATSYLWSRRCGLRKLASTVRIPLADERELAQHVWLVPTTVLLIGLVVAMALAVLLHNHDATLRVLVSQATLSQVVSLSLLARGDRRGLLQTGALALAVLAVTMFGWAWLQVGTSLTPLNALVVVLACTALMSVFYGLGLAKLLPDTSDWLTPARRMVPWLAAASLTAVVATLSVEALEFARAGEVRMAWPAIMVVTLTLVGLSLASLAAAVLPGRDPLGLSERGRTLYVYGAEIILALVFMHIRLSMPWLFQGFFQQFWPLIVMFIAFLGVGFAEICQRRKLNVLAEPLTNTGALLPVLPVAGYWAVDSQVNYSLLLICVGVLYAGLSVTRKSFGFGVLAALAANGGLWYFLNQQDGLGLLRHPQVWLIPPALCVLAAAYLNRKQLSESQMAAVRYGSSMVIYVSSTADIFLVGVGQAPWLPLVLGGLSLLGIAAGVLLRVRAFLFLGIAFLGLALFTMIWYAAVDLEQTWIWYACGAAVGVLILIGLGIAEKKGQQARELLERLKHWDA